MLKKYLTLCLAFFIFSSAFGGVLPVAGQTQDDSKEVRKLKNHLYDIGTGRDKKVVVKLKDGTKIRDCYLSEIAVDYLTVVELKTGAATNIDYEKVESVKGTKLKFPLYGKILLGVGATLVVLVILVQQGVIPENY